MKRILGLVSVEELLNGEDLEPRVAGPVRGFVEAGLGRFFEHRLGRLLEAKEDSDFCFVALDDSAKIADLRDADSSSFDGEDDLAGFAGLVVVEVEAAVDAAVCAFLLFGRTSAN